MLKVAPALDCWPVVPMVSVSGCGQELPLRRELPPWRDPYGCRHRPAGAPRSMGQHPPGGCVGLPDCPSDHLHVDHHGQCPPHRQRIARDPHMTSTESSSSPTPTGQPIVAITGASGYLGSVLVAAFGSAGFSVRRLVRTPAPDSSDRPFDLNSVGTSEILDGVDVLVHCAYDLTLTRRSEIWQTNVFGTTALLDRARVCRRPSDHRAVLNVSVPRDASAVWSRQARHGNRCVEPGHVCRPSGLGLRTRLGRDGRNSAPACRPSGASRLRAQGAPVHRARGLISLQRSLPWRRPNSCRPVPVGVAHPDPVPFTELLASFAASQGKPSPRYVPTPPMAVYGALRAAELLPAPSAGASRLPAWPGPAGAGCAES